MIYALVRLRRDAEARAEGIGFERDCTELAADHPVRARVAAILAELSGPVAGPSAAGSSSSGPSRDDDWTVGDPVALGVDSAVLRQHRELCERSAADACVVIRKGALVDEWYGPRYAEPMMAMSSTKSVTGLLVGLLAADGKLSIDDPVSRFIPQWKPGADAGVTIRHLLTMTSGLPDDRQSGDVGSVTDKETFAFARPVTARPGERWAYTNNGVFLVSPLIRSAAGEPVADFARRRLFEPLGMRRTRMHVYPAGQAWTHADMETTARDFARIGQLMLSNGRWRGRQIVPESWVRQSIRKSQPFTDYGMLWWLDVPNGYAARGYLDTNLYIFPERDLVVVRMQSKPVVGASRYEPAAFQLFKRMVR